jgi:hypothetical protein
MGRRGPKPQPASVKQAKGNPGHRPIGADPDALTASGQAETPEKTTAVGSALATTPGAIGVASSGCRARTARPSWPQASRSSR